MSATEIAERHLYAVLGERIERLKASLEPVKGMPINDFISQDSKNLAANRDIKRYEAQRAQLKSKYNL